MSWDSTGFGMLDAVDDVDGGNVMNPTAPGHVILNPQGQPVGLTSNIVQFPSPTPLTINEAQPASGGDGTSGSGGTTTTTTLTPQQQRPDLAAYVDQLYQTIYQRSGPADVQGETFWTNNLITQLASGLTLQQAEANVLQAFLQVSPTDAADYAAAQQWIAANPGATSLQQAPSPIVSIGPSPAIQPGTVTTVTNPPVTTGSTLPLIGPLVNSISASTGLSPAVVTVIILLGGLTAVWYFTKD